ncbi:unnamed protein product [Closterium sp. Naga37s-1]|nr:unnamed protein product [Closterium sp. Naga37s-1]CAI5509184.1 unnamed protein product [Closterium sp. Naga37s-1]
MALVGKKAELLQAQRHAVLQAEYDAWMSSPARSPAAAEEEDAWLGSSEDREVPQAEAEAADEVYSLYMAAEGDGLEDDSDLSSSCRSDAKLVGSEASSTTSGFSGSSCSGQSSSEEPSTASAVNILCLGDCKLNRYQSLVRGTPAASWRKLPTRRLQPDSTRPPAVAVVEKTAVTASGPGGGLMDGSAAQESLRQEVRVVAAVAAVAVVEKTAVTASGGALKPLQDGSAGSTRQLYLSASVLCGSRPMVAPSGGGLKEAAAQQSMRQEGGVGGAREVASRALVAVPGGSAAVQSTRQQQGRLGVATPGVREAASRTLAALSGGSLREGPASSALIKRHLEKVVGRKFGAWKEFDIRWTWEFVSPI